MSQLSADCLNDIFEYLEEDISIPQDHRNNNKRGDYDNPAIGISFFGKRHVRYFALNIRNRN